MTIRRQTPAFDADERWMLRSWLEYHRATLAMKCDGLTDEQLRTRSVPPSTMSLLGLIRHMTEVERNWFRHHLAREEPTYHYRDGAPDADFDDVDSADIADAFALWEEECESSREIEARFTSLDDIGHNAEYDFDLSLRWILFHMIEEYARHNGHADLLRQRIDGATGE